MEIIIWLFQLFIFFSIMISILSSLSKRYTEQTPKKKSVFDKPIQTYSANSKNEKNPRNVKSGTSRRYNTSENTQPSGNAASQQEAVKNLTTERERRRLAREKIDRSRGRARQDRANNKRRNSDEPILKEVKTFKNSKVIKKSKSPALALNEKSLVNAMVYKEILDKPVTFRKK
ncbi:hypothetical protein [Marinilactibacillus psychrotolerans]|uniref:Uncharacterized protein n=1 Tax=Marinilactibacillus psychrotolerans TaxID=191770 RepID=A0AAV3WVH7_9LACT|nr:hypothetical protein [Marinilactibacillus psychrotolerans]GEL68032.1 hypothetical protein MPS01_21870 [Marinilactibacillus psychrotolerans]GEQ36663.1 hypothetical protein M132T_21710 [Marinilactibacillus psychrotolerans]SDD33679.1 hypothetical protein SAMN04488013_12617 [Marinilactibacillus psychrotolerans]